MYLYGASGHCKVVIEAIKSSKKIKIDAVFDDNPKIDFILCFNKCKRIDGE